MSPTPVTRERAFATHEQTQTPQPYTRPHQPNRHIGQKFTTFTVLLIMLLAQFSAHTAPVQASALAHTSSVGQPIGPAIEWARWILELDFSQRNYATWRLVAGYDNTAVSPPMPVIVTEIVKDITATCRQVGTLRIDQGAALFDGAGYLACDLPSFVDELAALQSGLPLAGDCRCTTPDPFIYADLTLTRQTSFSTNPLFYEDSFRFHVPLTGKRSASSQWWLDGQTVPAYSWPLQSSGNALFSGVGAQYFVAGQTSATPINQPALDLAIQSTPTNHFLHWANSATASHFTWNSPFTMTTEETTVYIGYNPTTHNYLQGELRHLVVDPPCKSN